MLSLLLLLAIASDVRARRIPNALVVTMLGLGLAFSVLQPSPSAAGGPLRALGGVALGLAIWVPFWLLRMLGAGDVKLMAAAGAWLGPMGTVEASLLAALIGGALAVLVVAAQGSGMAVARSMAMWLGAMQHGQWMRPVPVSRARHQLPYGVALALGAAVAWWT